MTIEPGKLIHLKTALEVQRFLDIPESEIQKAPVVLFLYEGDDFDKVEARLAEAVLKTSDCGVLVSGEAVAIMSGAGEFQDFTKAVPTVLEISGRPSNPEKKRKASLLEKAGLQRIWQRRTLSGKPGKR